MGHEALSYLPRTLARSLTRYLVILPSTRGWEKGSYPQEAPSFTKEAKFAHQRMANGSSLKSRAQAKVLWLALRWSEEKDFRSKGIQKPSL